MAKGQKKSNREVRKPKQKKPAKTPENTSGIGASLTANIPSGKGRKK